MSQDQLKQVLQKGIAAARAERTDVAREALQEAVRLDPHNETAWLWLSSVATDDEERIACLHELLAINPNNEFALKGLRALGVEPVHAVQPAAATTVPVLDDARYARVQKPLDDFLRRYNPEPPDRQSIRWVRKTRGRYAERSAARLRQIAAAAAALVLLAAIGGTIMLVVQSGLLTDNGTAVAALATRVPSLAPAATFTATPGGSTPTPFPEPLAVPVTRVPAGATHANDPFGLATPTAIYPRLETNVAFRVEEAVNYYSIGAYEQAIAILSRERDSANSKHCYPSVVYYEALSEAGRGNFREATSLLDWAQAYEPPRGYQSCQDAALLLAGRAEVAYLQNARSADAITYSQQALEADPHLVQAIVVRARAEIAQGRRDQARIVVTQALLDRPDDTNLLVLASEIALLDGQPGVALEHAGHALALEPALLPALRLQAQGYLEQAAQAASVVQQLTYYGLAVQSAQTLLLYYPGEPSGYLLLAQARLGEGNADLAETALTRIIVAADNLPPDEQGPVEAALRLRGDLYYQQGRLDEAAADLQAAYRMSGDERLAMPLYEAALASGRILEADNWLAIMLSTEPANGQYLLLEAGFYVEACATEASPITCHYQMVLDTLDESFISGLASDDDRAQAYSYRAQARYQVVASSRAMRSDDRQARLQEALDDVVAALQVRQTARDLYLHGLLSEALGDYQRAYEDYQWVAYWQGAYQHSLVDAELDDNFTRLAEHVQPTLVPTLTPTATTQPPTNTPRPQVPTATPRATATPSALPPTAQPTQPVAPIP